MADYLNIDASDLNDKIKKLRAVHTEEEMKLLMTRALRRTGQHVKTILKRQIPKQYNARPTWIGQNVLAPKIGPGAGGSPVGCVIPLKGVRGVLGARFPISGGRGRPKKGVKRRISTKLLKGARSTLPNKLPNQGGNPPFIVQGGKTGGKKVVFTRRTDRPLPIVRVVGLSVPRMPLNRASSDVQQDIVDMLEKRMEHEHARLIDRCR